MRILMTSGIFPPDIGGPASYVPKMAKALTARGHQVTVVCLSDRLDHQDASAYPFLVVRIWRNGFKPYRILKTIATIRSIAKSVDVVFANTLPTESAIGALLARRPVVHKIVGDYAWETARNKGWFNGSIDEYQSAQKSILLKLLDVYIKKPLNWATHLFAPSEYLAQIVRGWGNYKTVSVVYNAVQLPPPSTLNVQTSDQRVHLITICRLVSWKGVDEILTLLPQFPQTVLTIVGEGPEREKLEHITEKLNLKDRVRFAGHLSNAETMQMLQTADIFLLNSTYEGLPHVVLEAMFYKKTVICNDAGGCREVVRHMDTGFLMQKNTPDRSLSDALKLVLSNEVMREKMAANGYNAVHDSFTFDHMVSKTEIILENAKGCN